MAARGRTRFERRGRTRFERVKLRRENMAECAGQCTWCSASRAPTPARTGFLPKFHSNPCYPARSRPDQKWLFVALAARLVLVSFWLPDPLDCRLRFARRGLRTLPMGARVPR